MFGVCNLQTMLCISWSNRKQICAVIVALHLLPPSLRTKQFTKMQLNLLTWKIEFMPLRLITAITIKICYLSIPCRNPQIPCQSQLYIRINNNLFTPRAHYIPHPAGNPMSLSSYYPMYLLQTHQPLQTDPLYLLPVNQSQPYNLNGVVPSNIADFTIGASSQSLTPHLGATYNETIPFIYPMIAANTISKLEMGLSIYRTMAIGGMMC